MLSVLNVNSSLGGSFEMRMESKIRRNIRLVTLNLHESVLSSSLGNSLLSSRTFHKISRALFPFLSGF